LLSAGQEIHVHEWISGFLNHIPDHGQVADGNRPDNLHVVLQEQSNGTFAGHVCKSRFYTRMQTASGPAPLHIEIGSVMYLASLGANALNDLKRFFIVAVIVKHVQLDIQRRCEQLGYRLDQIIQPSPPVIGKYEYIQRV
jgi:hypothetical protein